MAIKRKSAGGHLSDGDNSDSDTPRRNSKTAGANDSRTGEEATGEVGGATNSDIAAVGENDTTDVVGPLTGRKLNGRVRSTKRRKINEQEKKPKNDRNKKINKDVEAEIASLVPVVVAGLQNKRRRPGTSNSGSPSAKKPRTVSNEPSNTYPIPRNREIFNVEHQGYPRGHIQSKCEKEEPIAWLVSYTQDPEVGKIYFGCFTWRRGGPFNFLHDSFPCMFTVAAMGTAEFTSVGHFLHFGRARCIQTLPERFSNSTPPLSSKDLAFQILVASNKSPHELACLGASFNHLRTSDPAWWSDLTMLVKVKIQFFAGLALRAKFEQNLDLKIKLMMTGNYRLYLASRSHNGIGCLVREAIAKKDKVLPSILGEHLESLRSEFRQEEPEWPTTYAFEYFHEIEKTHPLKVDDETLLGEEDLVAQSDGFDALKENWLALGGEPLKKRLNSTQQKVKKLREDQEAIRQDTETRRIAAEQERGDTEHRLHSLDLWRS